MIFAFAFCLLMIGDHFSCGEESSPDGTVESSGTPRKQPSSGSDALRSFGTPRSSEIISERAIVPFLWPPRNLSKQKDDSWISLVGSIANEKSKRGNPFLHEAIADVDSLSKIEAMLEGGADVNMKSSNGDCALHIAVQKRNVELLRLLLNRLELKKNKRNAKGETSLAVAICIPFPNYDIIRTLVHDPEVNLRDINRKGDNALMLAVGRGLGNIVEMILSMDPDILNDKNKLKETALHYSLKLAVDRYDKITMMLLNYGISVTDVAMNGDTPLHLALKQGRFEVIDGILGNPACDVNALNANDETPLDIALKYASDETANMFSPHFPATDSPSTPTIEQVLNMEVELWNDWQANRSPPASPCHKMTLEDENKLDDVISSLLLKGAKTAEKVANGKKLQVISSRSSNLNNNKKITRRRSLPNLKNTKFRQFTRSISGTFDIISSCSGKACSKVDWPVTNMKPEDS